MLRKSWENAEKMENRDSGLYGVSIFSFTLINYLFDDTDVEWIQNINGSIAELIV